VLVDEARQPRVHDHEDPAAQGPRLVGRNREHKLVHFDGPEALVGTLVSVEIDRAGAYALSGHRPEGADHA
jgi:tRNA A37 methylthiotransferase MiaB